MSEAISICYKCVRFRSDYNTGSISCRCNGFYPDRPHTMPKKCRNYEFDERKDDGVIAMIISNSAKRVNRWLPYESEVRDEEKGK